MSGEAPKAVTVDTELALAMLRDMVRIRRFEERCADLYGQQKIRGFLHLYIGEEAVAAGAMRALAPDDAVVATYREHGHALVRGVPATAIMAEMYGRREGCSRGRGGSTAATRSSAADCRSPWGSRSRTSCRIARASPPRSSARARSPRAHSTSR